MSVTAPQPFGRFPFVRIALAFASGITLQRYWTFDISGMLPALAVLIWFFRFSSLAFRFRWAHLEGIRIFFLIACLGAWRVDRTDIQRDPAWIGRNTQNDTLLIEPVPPWSEKSGSRSAEAFVRARWKRGRWLVCKGRILLVIPEDAASFTTEPALLIRGSLPSIELPYYFNHQVFHRCRCTMNDLALPAQRAGPGDRFLREAIHVRSALAGILRQHISGSNNQAMAEALLLGLRSRLDAATVQAFNATGVTHIIAVSGMHLGLLYGLTAGIFSLLPVSSLTRAFRAGCALLLLWAFAFLTAFPPSVMRAAVMFSFLSLGDLLQKRTNSLNSLAASAFFILWFDPFLLTDTGFQLSYAAVAGIITMRGHLKRLADPRNRLLNALWNMACVTLAAQLFTFPLLLHYFRQFPNLFLPANLVLVPLSGFILYTEIALLILHPLNFGAGFAGQVTGRLIEAQDAVPRWLGRLPFAVSAGHTGITGCVLLYAVIASCCIWIANRKPRAFLWACFFFCTLLAMRLI